MGLKSKLGSDPKFWISNPDHGSHVYRQLGYSWVIDYKTSEPSEHHSHDHFFKQESANYSEKMKLYQQALAATDHKEIKIALYFPLIDELLVLD